MMRKAVYNNINVERARLNMSVEELCQRLGIGKRTYYSWQKTGKIPVPKLIDMAIIFDCSLDYLVGRATV